MAGGAGGGGGGGQEEWPKAVYKSTFEAVTQSTFEAVYTKRVMYVCEVYEL